MKTGQQYIENMIAMDFELYVDGTKIRGAEVVDHPLVRPMINAVAATYDMQHEEKLQEQLLCESSLTGKTIKFQVYDTSDTDTQLWTEDGTVGGDDNNQVTIDSDDTNTGTPGGFRYKMWNTDDDQLIARGVLTIDPGPEVS